MKWFVASLLLVVFGFLPTARAEQTYGKGVSAGPAMKMAELLGAADKYAGKKVKVSGLVTDVCSKRGCWMRLAGERDFETLRVKVNDGEMVFPLSAKGKTAVVEGVFTKLSLSRDEAVARAKHLAEEKGQSFDPNSVKGPEVTYEIRGEGAVIQ